MEDKELILKQIGWSEELINECLSRKSVSETKLSQADYFVPNAFEQDTTSLTVSIDTPTISDGTRLNP